MMLIGRVCFLLLFFVSSLSADDEGDLLFPLPVPSEKWTITTRWDYRVRIDGRYVGHSARELRELYRKTAQRPGGWLVEGEARLLGETKRNGVPVATRVEESDSIQFILSNDGSISRMDVGYPRLRGFPTFPEDGIKKGDSWEAPLDILVRGPDGQRGLLNQIASYRYVGRNSYMGREAHFFEVQWAVRYKGFDPVMNQFLKNVEGSHQVRLVVDAESGAPIMARDKIQEVWQWTNSGVEKREGFALMFWKGVAPLERSTIKETFRQYFDVNSGSAGSSSNPAASDKAINPSTSQKTSESPATDAFRTLGNADSDNQAVSIDETERGLSVTLRNLNFQPDLALLIPGQEPVLEELSTILKSIPKRTVVVRGHTADVGRPEAQYKLSEERAATVANALSRHGVDPRRLIYEGVGADEPQASNASDEGRRQNRRVELIILED